MLIKSAAEIILENSDIRIECGLQICSETTPMSIVTS